MPDWSLIDDNVNSRVSVAYIPEYDFLYGTNFQRETITNSGGEEEDILTAVAFRKQDTTGSSADLNLCLSPASATIEKSFPLVSHHRYLKSLGLIVANDGKAYSPESGSLFKLF